MLSLESTKLISDPTKTHDSIEYDTKMHRRLSLNHLYAFNKMHIVTKGLWPYPAKTFFLLAHNKPYSQEVLLAHPLINHLSQVKTQEQLLSLPSHPLMPRAKAINFKDSISSNHDIDLVEFQQSFYTEAFKDPNMRPSDQEPLNLRLCAFVDLKEENKMNIPFSRAIASRFISVFFTDTHDHTMHY